jgi:hypothetical protein
MGPNQCGKTTLLQSIANEQVSGRGLITQGGQGGRLAALHPPCGPLAASQPADFHPFHCILHAM